MSKNVFYHRHGDEIHIEVKDNGVVIDHSCIAVVNENRPNWLLTAEYILRACIAFEDIEESVSLIVRKDHYYQLEAQAKSHPDLLAACEISATCFRKLAGIGMLASSKHILLDNVALIEAAIDKSNKET